MQTYSILLVDDDLSVLKAIGLFLESLGYLVTTAKSGEDAIELLNNSIFGLVITDLIMGDVDGYQVLETGKKLRSETMFIVLTGRSDPAFIINALRLGADDYLIKPCEPEEMRFRVERCLEKVEIKKKAKQAEEALRESEERYRRFIENSPVAMFAINTKGEFTYANKRLLKMTGYDPEEWANKPSNTFLHPEDLSIAMEKIQKRLSGQGSSEPYEIRIYHASGDTLWVKITPESIYKTDESGEKRLVGTQCFVQDITSRKLAEQALKESEEKFRLISEQSLMAIVMIQDDRIKYANQAYLAMTGYTWEEITNWTVGDTAQLIYPDDRPFVMEQGRKKAAGITDGVVIHYSYRGVSKSGEVRWIDQYSKTITYRGKPADLMTFIDIHEQKVAEEELLKAKKMESVGILAGGVAHEFNNALMGVMGSIELLQMDLPEDERRGRHFEAMNESGYRMSRLTDQLLAYAQGGKYQPKDLKLGDFVMETLPILHHDLSPEVRVETHFPKVSYIKADHAQMQMVLSAILNNSNEAIEDKGLIRITAGNKNVDEDFAKQHPGFKPGDYVCLTIEDDGKGMDEETRDGIFEPFFTTKFQGRGMGMAAVYGIVKNHDGWIYVDSELGKGATVRIYLPAISAESKEQGAVKQSEIEMGTGEGTILMIEDEDVVIEVTQAMLEWLGYRVMVAKTGKDAIHITETFDGRIDLAILDIKLPDMGGGKVYPLIMKARPALKVIVFSGYSIEGPARKILDAGAQDFIQKPFSIAALSEKIKKVLE